VKVCQRLEIQYRWKYLALAVDSLRGKLWWKWTENMKKESVAAVVRAWRRKGLAGLVWDRAPSHRAALVKQVGVKLVPLEAYSPELNPPERVFEELRARVEGRIYGELEKKVEAVERVLRQLAGDPERVKRLAGWSWIQRALRHLPT
jgi:transposase